MYTAHQVFVYKRDYLLQVEVVMATVATLEDYDGFNISEVDSNPLGMCVLAILKGYAV